ncbi:MAG: glycoside hydrolase family 97 protein [Pirellulales bacterium]
MNSLTKHFCAWILWLSWGLSALAAPAASATVTDAPPTTAGPLKVKSPDGTIEVMVHVDGPLTYSVTVDGQSIIENARLGLKLHEGTTLGADVELSSSASRSEDSNWENPLGKRRVVRNQYRELTLLLAERSAKDRTFQLVFRLFDDGVAFRYVLLSQPGMRDFVLDQELTEFRFPADTTCYAGEHEKGMRSSQEWEFRRQQLSEITPDAVKGLPVLVETPAAWVAIAEADLLEWSGMWIGGKPQEEASETASAVDTPEAKPSTAVTLVAKLAPRLDGEGLVKAETPHHSSWRVLMIGRQPGRLIESEIIRNLSTPPKLADASWVKPGMMAWDHWWTGDTIMDTATIKSYIQLAADMGWEYQLIDWQWYGKPEQNDADITKVIPELDMEEVRRFAAERGVRLWLWLHWTDVDRKDAYRQAFPLYEKWGIAGVKIDFMDRDDQEMVDWYEKITAAAAEHKLMVNFHGAFKTSGFDRTYPNQVTREGILGNEYNKWSGRVTPEHKLTLPFTRFLEGPADFTPGGFLNRQPGQFKTNVKPTQVQGTRAGELALFVCYDSPVCCVCDHPDHLRDQPGADFLKIVPTVWDETRVLDGAVGEHLVMVRQSGDDWYLGAMTNREPREIPVKLDFLDGGQWKLKLWQDADDSSENAEQLTVDEQTVAAGDTITLKLAPSGGCVGHFERL